MKMRNDFLIAIAVVLSVLALAAIITTEPYSVAAGAQAKDFDALAHQIFPIGTDTP